ncbi:alkyl hydroperoxide reductase AhpD [Deinococcus arenae]|uniref:Alkyl hydroperoxide reductase AhpD n=1 Tax=Deinococcus arenae TaxID=1452751 RepID=A0A8H9L400_9DEIO|nr:peroxidase-related enzyme [Deinococcus arenae]AWT35854.1 alkylhydroperoxidase [Deinococcus actinosclerus]GGM31202.1 alkyl hydroperoxide reductase AhpD [Deinococcus arenae]
MNRISWLAVPDEATAPEGVQKLWAKAQGNLGFVPNVFRAQALNPDTFLAWWHDFNTLVNRDGHLTNADRELLAVVVSGLNRCVYCAVSHGAALRDYTGDAALADTVAVNWRHAPLTPQQAALCAYAEKLTLTPAHMTEDDLRDLRAAGLIDHAILEATQVIGMFNMTNRVSSALGFTPNAEYHRQGR